MELAGTLGNGVEPTHNSPGLAQVGARLAVVDVVQLDRAHKFDLGRRVNCSGSRGLGKGGGEGVTQLNQVIAVNVES